MEKKNLFDFSATSLLVIKGFVIPTKSFVKIGITKTFSYNQMFSSINKTFWLLPQNVWLQQQKI